VIAAELAGQVVSMVFLDRRHADGVPRRHFHIFDPDLRWQGLGQLILKAGIQVFAKEHGIKRFLIEPKADNKRMNRLMQKVGLKHVRDCVVSAGPATQEMSRSRRQSYCAVRCRQSS
jgi:RimJ/RimL family protein N-acetyltransferase